MIRFKTLNSRTQFRLEKIIKFFMQAISAQATGTLYIIYTNDVGLPTETNELGLLLGTGDKVSLSTYIYEVIPNKIVHYSLYEFKWVNGLPVLRTEPLLLNPNTNDELVKAFNNIAVESKSLIDYWFKRIEEVFKIDLNTY